MKKTKILFITVLAVILCLLCVANFTFSWFTLPRAQNGDSLEWNGITYDLSSKSGITIETFESFDDGENFSDTPVTEFSNSIGIAGEERKYYRTDISNGSDYAQSVSLYLSNLSIPTSSTGDFYIGVNGPLRTYKEFSKERSYKEESIINKKHIYVGFNTAQTYTPTNYQIHWWDKNNSNYNGDSTLLGYSSLSTTKTYLNYTYKMTYGVIPWDASAVKLHQGNTWYGNDNTDIDSNNTICVYGGSNVEYVMSDFAAGLYSYYSSASVPVGETIDLGIKDDTSRCKSVKYITSNSSVATVSNAGVVKGIKEGTAKITVTVYGIYGDSIYANCDLTVTSNGLYYTDVPIVTNLRV